MSRPITSAEADLRGYTPAAQKRLAENKLEQPEPLEAGRPDAPPYFSEAERAVWDSTILMIEKRGTLTPGDGPTITLYSTTSVELRTERKLLDAEGRVCTVSRLDRMGREIVIRAVNPRVRIVRDLEKLMLSLVRELGLTPLRRHGVKHARNANALNAGERALRESELIFSRKRAN
jgi:phage terminase small subunit